jgi:protein-tyrosine-phosphatase
MPPMDRPYHVLFLCTGNSARSIIAEASLNAMSDGIFKAFSAGSQPKGKLDPDVVAYLAERGISTKGARSKGWEEFAGKGAPPMDFVITVCDSAAGETCPIWPGHPVTAHWGVEDPAAVADPARKRRVIETAFLTLRRRIELLVNLPMAKLDRLALEARAREIGREE